MKEVLTEKQREIIEGNGFSIEALPFKMGEKDYVDVELHRHTPAGEDWSLLVRTTPETTFMDGLKDLAEDTAWAEDDFATWVDAKRTNAVNGVPEISELYEDMQWKIETVKRLYSDLAGNGSSARAAGNAGDKTATIVALEHDGLDIRSCAITLRLFNVSETPSEPEIREMVRKACVEYCRTEQGRKDYRYSCGSFNWIDFYTSVPAEICRRHGFEIIPAQSEDIVVDWDEPLVSDFDLEDENEV